MTINRDEVRRQLSASKQDQAEAMPRFREALKRAFDRDRGATEDEKAALLGVPSRRAFLTVGGAAVVGSAVLAGCVQPTKKVLPVSGTSIPDPSSTTTTAPGTKELDLTLLRTAQSIEVLAVQTYQKILDGGIVQTASTLDAMKLFQSQHNQHAGLLATTTTDNGGKPYDTANPYLDVEVITPALTAATTEAAVLKVAALLENTAAQTYTGAGGTFTTASLRGAILSIGAVEARHLTVLYTISQGNPVPLSLMPTHLAIPPVGYIGENGPVKEPVAPATTEAPPASGG